MKSVKFKERVRVSLSQSQPNLRRALKNQEKIKVYLEWVAFWHSGLTASNSLKLLICVSSPNAEYRPDLILVSDLFLLCFLGVTSLSSRESGQLNRRRRKHS